MQTFFPTFVVLYFFFLFLIKFWGTTVVYWQVEKHQTLQTVQTFRLCKYNNYPASLILCMRAVCVWTTKLTQWSFPKTKPQSVFVAKPDQTETAGLKEHFQQEGRHCRCLMCSHCRHIPSVQRSAVCVSLWDCFCEFVHCEFKSSHGLLRLQWMYKSIRKFLLWKSFCSSLITS